MRGGLKPTLRFGWLPNQCGPLAVSEWEKGYPTPGASGGRSIPRTGTGIPQCTSGPTRPGSERPMLTIEDLKKSYLQPDGTPLPVLEIAEFHAEAGEQVVLVGEAAAGRRPCCT